MLSFGIGTSTVLSNIEESNHTDFNQKVHFSSSAVFDLHTTFSTESINVPSIYNSRFLQTTFLFNPISVVM